MRSLFYIVALIWPGLVLADSLPAPSIPPHRLPATDAAPVPNVDIRAPSQQGQQGPSFNIRFYRAGSYDPSMGFAPGSRYQTNEDRKPIQTPGFSITVPLQ